MSLTTKSIEEDHYVVYQMYIYVFFEGETSAGKSTIINRIIDERELLPTRITACTRKICRIGYSHIFSISSKDCNSKELETSVFRDREELTKTLKGIVQNVSPDIVYVDIGMPLPMLQVYEETSVDFKQLLRNYIFYKHLYFCSICNEKQTGHNHFAK